MTVSRREFLKSAALAAILAACGKLPPPDTAIPSTDRPKPVTPEPTDKPKATDTPDIPATKEAERLNAVLAEGYPTSFAELSPEKMLSEAEFLKQLEKFPNVGKEYKQVKAMLSAGLSKAGVKLEEIDFETSSYPWDADKYSWIVMARNKKTGEVYVPRDEKTHTRNIDMSVYGYLKEYQAGGVLPFTMEKLKLPEFSGPEYKIGFARSKKGWLAATLTNTESKSTIGWYDFRANPARWMDERNNSLFVKEGVAIESANYSPDEIRVLEKLVELMTVAYKNSLILEPVSVSPGKQDSGVTYPVSKGNITVGYRECFLSDGKKKKIPVAWQRSTGAYVLPTNSGRYVLSPASETGMRLRMMTIADLGETPARVLSGGFIETDKEIVVVEYPDMNKVQFVWRGQSMTVSADMYREFFLMYHFIPERQQKMKRIEPVPTIDGPEISDQEIDDFSDSMLAKSASGKYVRILGGEGLINEDGFKLMMRLLKKLDSEEKKIFFKYLPKIKIVLQPGLMQQQYVGKNTSEILVSADQLVYLQTDAGRARFLSGLLHEQRHSVQSSYNPQEIDNEALPYYMTLVDMDRLGIPSSDQYRNYLKGLFLSGNYKIGL